MHSDINKNQNIFLALHFVKALITLVDYLYLFPFKLIWNCLMNCLQTVQ